MSVSGTGEVSASETRFLGTRSKQGTKRFHVLTHWQAGFLMLICRMRPGPLQTPGHTEPQISTAATGHLEKG
jgi:hypothetical protein